MNQTVIITGGTKGLGRETSLAFGRAGWTVLALYSSDETAARELLAEMTAANLSGTVLQHDVRSEENLIWNRTEIRAAGRLVLVNNACATFSPAPMHQLEWRDFENSFLVAVKGARTCSQALIRLMIKQANGAIVNVLTSALEGAPPKGFAAYLTAKYGLKGFTLALAAEYAARGVKIFSVSPGFMETPLTQQWNATLRDTIRANSGRLTDPVTAAARIVSLVSDPGTLGEGEDYPL
jgi:NAD(P)-dependent dehydrogenase (short-subunit alcohol dehydrogenase family)